MGWPAGLLLPIVLCSTVHCGYRPLRGTLPGTLARVYVAAPDVTRTDEPLLSALLRQALSQQLSRRGAALAPGAAHAAVLGSTAHVLRTEGVALSGKAVGGATLSLRLEAWLVDAAGAGRRRSGPIEVREHWPMSGDALQSEHNRELTLERLGRRAAALAVERLLPTP